jgi:hypothetical protein
MEQRETEVFWIDYFSNVFGNCNWAALRRLCGSVSCAITSSSAGCVHTWFQRGNSGVMPEPGLTYSNTFMDYSFNEAKCTVCGELVPHVDVLLDVNVFMWVSKKKILGGNYVLVAGLRVTNSSLSLAGLKPIGGGGGFADSFYQPATLGWHLKRADIMVAYAFFAPTGRFTAGASNNTGTGHWTNAPTAGETLYLTKNKGTAFSAYQMYEFHTTQEGTNLHPGQTFDLDNSLYTDSSVAEGHAHTAASGGGRLRAVADEQQQRPRSRSPASRPLPGQRLEGRQISFCRSERLSWASSFFMNSRTRTRFRVIRCRLTG